MLDSPRRRRAALVAGSVALAAVAAGVVLTRGDAPSGVPVFVVTGYGGERSSVATLAEALRAAGRDVRVVVPPENGRAGIDVGAAALERHVRESRADRVDVVGYSAGGVVARAWATAHPGRARHVVTLGSPHHGTTLIANLGAAAELCAGACADLRPGSGLLARLNAGDETPEGPAWVTVRTDGDETVTPPETAALDGARNVRVQDVCPGRRVSHGGLVRDPVVLRWVVAVTAVPDAPLTC